MINRALLATMLVATTAIADPKKPPAPAAAAAPRLEPDDLPGPQPEVAKQAAKVELPAIPAFELPAAEPGFRSPRELRVRGKRLLGTEVQVKGYVTWIYDCAASLAGTNPNASRAQIAAAIQKDPTLCEKPKFYLGDAKDTSRDASIWVVDVPRAGTKGAPKIALGDRVMITGTWALYSPHAERNTAGLLVYQALAPVAPGGAAPVAAPPAPAEADLDVVTRTAMRPVVPEATRSGSVEQLNTCNKAIVARQFDAAITACQTATATWSGNHLAWYAMASAHMARNEWPKAREAVEHAVTLRPDIAMYQLYYGISLYEAERERVRGEQARRDSKKPEEVEIEPGLLKLDAARDALRRAVKRGPDLWRAHYYLGRVYRDLDDARHEAEQFSATIATHPSYRFGYIALIELYRRWSYLDEALAVARLGTTQVPPAEAPELWFELGMAYDAKRDDDKAIDAFSKAIAGKPGDLGSKFQRGQIYFRRADYANAQRDLDEVARSGDPTVAGIRPLANQMLGQIARKQR